MLKFDQQNIEIIYKIKDLYFKKTFYFLSSNVEQFLLKKTAIALICVENIRNH